MASTFSINTGLEKHADGDTTWGAGMRDNLDTIDSALAPSRTFWVSPEFTVGNMPALSNATDRRHFDTIQGAIDAGEANAYDQEGYGIIVFPGRYSENLTIVSSVHITSALGPMTAYYAGANVHLNGTTGSQSPVITVTPANDTWTRVMLSNLNLDNQCTVADATEITTPYLIDWQSATRSGASNKLALSNCQIRMQTWGLDNVWTYGIKVHGKVHTYLKHCMVAALDYGGSNNNGGVRYMLSVQGESSTRPNQCYVEGCKWNTVFSGSGSNFTFRQEGDSNIWVFQGFYSQASSSAISQSGTGNTGFGFLGQEATYQNTFGINLVQS